MAWDWTFEYRIALVKLTSLNSKMPLFCPFFVKCFQELKLFNKEKVLSLINQKKKKKLCDPHWLLVCYAML